MVLSLKRQLSRNDILFEFNNIRSLGGQLMISSEQLALANSKILNVIALTVTNPRHLKVSLTCKLVIKYAFKFICGYRRITGSKIQSFISNIKSKPYFWCVFLSTSILNFTLSQFRNTLLWCPITLFA